MTSQQPENLESGRLRDEILQAQRVRSDLLKWKLALVGTLSAVGLGLAGSRQTSHADLVLCAVPLVSVYVDLLASHLSIRILVIGTYFRAGDGYEAHAKRARALKLGGGDADSSSKRSAFDLEDWAMTGSTGFLSVVVLLYGVFIAADPSKTSSALSIPFLVSGITGLAMSLVTRRSYRARFAAVDRMER
jgi:hypothetical protein